ncbi:MAG: YdeI/OmpD-associated family protein [Bacteroidia bacterium]|nr:YdeI/OmpD-associated family protein [Bacteroidia bacterium]
MQKKETEIFCPANREAWRQWLLENHRRMEAVWLVYYRKSSGIPSVLYSEAVDEALCFGWIDSKRLSLGDGRYKQFYCPRKSRSGWSKVNKEKVERLIAEGRMTEAGLRSIEAAKKNGSWTLLDEVEEAKIPADLAQAFREHPGTRKAFLALSRSVRKMMLQQLVFAKRAETRAKRIQAIVKQVQGSG